ncbi:hypothetical protein H5410_017039 [Solanum commersonii]|uniref:Uncharacterized protein n=1 Tax=Solanum commersonii TaxID=4109 RepID=A0A9J5ZZD7_SOLCO|nr:hypothetical protein H5410_017039 [Solanum commersonii]
MKLNKRHRNSSNNKKKKNRKQSYFIPVLMGITTSYKVDNMDGIGFCDENCLCISLIVENST